MDKKAVGARIKQARNALKLTQEDVANKAEATSKRGLQDNEAGNAIPGGAILAALVESGINANWVLTGEGPMLLSQDVESHASYHVEHQNGFVAIPIYEEVQASAGPGVLPPEVPAVQVLKFSEEWIRHELRAAPGDLYLISVDGDSMEPTLRAGDVILIDHRVTHPNREGVYILRMDGALLVKRLQFRPGGQIDVISDNAAYSSFSIRLADMEPLDFAILGKVVWSGRRM
jgi:phage repressor protein C with HTH and peptisase S24 domain